MKFTITIIGGRNMATIIDVANRAKVSPMTASRVINGSHKGVQSIKDAVNNAVAELHYIPNNAARSLVTKSNKTLAMLVPSIANPFYGRVLLGIESEAEKQGYSVSLTNANKQLKYDLCIDNIISRGVDGVIAILLNLKSEHIKRLNDRGIEVVLIDNEMEIENVNSIMTDNIFGAKLAVDHLVSLKHTKIAHIHGNLSPSYEHLNIDDEDTFRVNYFKQRYLGYYESMKNHNIEVMPEYVVSANSRFGADIQSGANAMATLLSLKQPPTAIYATNDGIALGAASTMIKYGIRIGTEVSLISHGGIYPKEIIYPSLTQIKQPRFELGKLAAKKIISTIQNGTKYSKDIVMPELVIGESTKICNY